MKKALKMMWEMQTFLAERGIDAHVNVTTCRDLHSVEIAVFYKEGDERKILSVSWANYRADEFPAAWAEFETAVREKFFGWWEE